MTTPDNRLHPAAGPQDDTLPDALRFQLRALRRDEVPARDLWPELATRLPARVGTSSRRRSPWRAVAASLLFATGAVGVWHAAPSVQPAQAPLALQEAERMGREYRVALRQLPDAGASPTLAPAIGELDRSAADIRRALAHDPDSRLLLDQLRRTYSRRLELTQRALHS